MIQKLFRNARIREIFLYVVVGALTTAVNYAVYFLFTRAVASLAGVPADTTQWLHQLGNAIAWVCAVSFAFYPNKKYVFRREGGNLRREVLDFAAARLLSLGVSALALAVLTGAFGLNDMVAQAIVQVIVIAANYFASRFWIFRKK